MSLAGIALAEVLARPDIWRGADAVGAVSPVTIGNPRGTPTLASGFPLLDAELPGGGWPRGQLTELLAEQVGIGEMSLLLPALARLTQAGRLVVLLAPPYRIHAPAWAAAGVDVSRLRVLSITNQKQALWAAVQVLRCPGVGAGVLWLEAFGQLAANSLRRLQVAAAEGGGVAFLHRPVAVAGNASPAPLRIRLGGANGALTLHLLKRRGASLGHPLQLDLPRPAPCPRVLPHVVAGHRLSILRPRHSALA
jgi:cell division inhibitor SulA